MEETIYIAGGYYDRRIFRNYMSDGSYEDENDFTLIFDVETLCVLSLDVFLKEHTVYEDFVVSEVQEKVNKVGLGVRIIYENYKKYVTYEEIAELCYIFAYTDDVFSIEIFDNLKEAEKWKAERIANIKRLERDYQFYDWVGEFDNKKEVWRRKKED